MYSTFFVSFGKKCELFGSFFAKPQKWEKKRLPEAGKQSKKDPFRVEAPRYVFCHRMGAFYQCVPEISGEGIRILSKDYEKVKKFTEIRRMLEKYDCSFLELIV